MTSDPLVTVITPAFNVVPYLAETIESVLNQTVADFEYLIVDDSSTDETLRLANAYANKDSRLRVLPNDTHRGSGAARNQAMRMAQGKYISFIDGDDIWHREFLERQLKAIESADDDVAAVFARVRTIDALGRVVGYRWRRRGKYDFDEMLIGACPPASGSNLIFRRECFEGKEFSETLQSAIDFDMWLRIYDDKFRYFVCNPQFLVDVRRREGSITSNQQSRLDALDQLLETHAPAMRSHKVGHAYVRPVIMSFSTEYVSFGQSWIQQVRTLSFLDCLRNPDVLRARLWAWLPLPIRKRVQEVVARIRVGAAAAAKRWL